MKTNHLSCLSLILLMFFSVSCIDSTEEVVADTPLQTRSYLTNDMEWEDVDFLPTPACQSPKITPPWSGDGNILSVYDLQVANDYRKIDGWELLYSTFHTGGTNPLVNPYFVLYNKYRGLLRFYMYLTTEDIEASSSIIDGISLVSASGTTSSILNYLGETIIDVQSNKTHYSQLQPSPKDGSAPLASYRWYMTQYELAYDPSLQNTLVKDVCLNWSMNSQNVTSVSLNGSLAGSITSATVGGSGENDVMSDLRKVGTTVGKGAASALGYEVLFRNKKSDGTNNFNIKPKYYNKLLEGLQKSMAMAFGGDLPKQAFGLLNSILGFNSAGPEVNLVLQAKLNLEGEMSSQASFPSFPRKFNIPGTFDDGTFFDGQIPLYNKSLGVFNLSQKPVVHINHTIFEEFGREGFEILISDTYDIPSVVDYSDIIVINPEVEQIANVRILKQELIAIQDVDFPSYTSFYLDAGSTEEWDEKTTCYVKPVYGRGYPYNSDNIYFDLMHHCYFAVRIILQVSPYNGAPPTTIVKTFKVDVDETKIYESSL